METGSKTIPVVHLADTLFQVEYALDNQLLIYLTKSQVSYAIYHSISNSIVAYGRYGLTSTNPFNEAAGILKTDDWAKQPFAIVRLVVQPDDFVLVPKDLFDPREIATYLNFHSFKEVGGSQQFDRMEPIGVVGVYHLPHAGMNALAKLYPSMGIFASPTPFIQLAIREYSKQKGDNLLVLFDGGLMHVMVLNQTKMTFYNSFEVEAKEDVSYYTLAVCEQLSLSPEKVNVVVWGGDEGFDERFATVKYYFRNVNQGERPMALKFSAGLSTLPFYSEYPLFAAALCE